MIKKTAQITAYVIFGLALIGWSEQLLKWFIRTYDPVYRNILDHKTRGANDTNHMGETVFAVLRSADNPNGDARVIEGAK